MKIQISVDGTAYEVEVEGLEEGSLTSPASVAPPARTTIQSAVVPTAAKLSSHPEDGDTVDETKVCRSPVAGIVVQVHAQAGARVQADELLLVLEAMKMETRISTPVAGTLRSVKVAPGEAVKLNQVLAEFF